MTETVGKEIMLEGVDPRELYGAQDVYLEQIKSLHPTLKIVARGQSLKVLGPEADTQRFSKRMEGLAAYYVKYGHVSAEVIEQCFAGGIAQDDAPVDKDVIVYGNNGTIVRARTVNQQRLVKLYDRNDLLFAVGPAGSGKTYTAIALAVRALKERQVRRIILTRPAVEAGERLAEGKGGRFVGAAECGGKAAVKELESRFLPELARLRDWLVQHPCSGERKQ